MPTEIGSGRQMEATGRAWWLTAGACCCAAAGVQLFQMPPEGEAAGFADFFDAMQNQLPHAFAGELETLCDGFKSPRFAVVCTQPQDEDFPIPVRQLSHQHIKHAHQFRRLPGRTCGRRGKFAGGGPLNQAVQLGCGPGPEVSHLMQVTNGHGVEFAEALHAPAAQGFFQPHRQGKVKGVQRADILGHAENSRLFLLLLDGAFCPGSTAHSPAMAHHLLESYVRGIIALALFTDVRSRQQAVAARWRERTRRCTSAIVPKSHQRRFCISPNVRSCKSPTTQKS